MSVASYRDNGSATYPFTVNVKSSDKNEQIIAVAVALCPDLLLLSSSWSLSSSKQQHQQHDDDDCDDDETASLPDSVGSSASSDEAPLEPPEEAVSSEHHEFLTVRPLFGGLSNELFVVAHCTTNAQVLVRIHPDTSASTNGSNGNSNTNTNTNTNIHTNSIVDRDVESKLVAWLSSVKEAPIYYGRFRNGSVEEFYPDVLTLTCAEMNTYAADIGSLLGRWHSLELPLAANIFPTNAAADTNNEQLPGAIWNRLEDWFDMVQQQQQPSSSSFLRELQTEWLWLKAAFQRHYNYSDDTTTTTTQQEARHFLAQVVLTHMDCQSLNLLKSKPTATATDDSSKPLPLPLLRLIDYEYAGLNPRAADLANTFCEFCNMNSIAADYAKEYPTAAVQDEFLRAYLRQSTALTAAKAACSSHDDDDESESTTMPSDALLTTMRQEIGRYTVLSHLQWAVWSLIQQNNRNSCSSGTTTAATNGGFDYLAYAKHRMEGYRHHKRLFWGDDAAAK